VWGVSTGMESFELKIGNGGVGPPSPSPIQCYPLGLSRGFKGDSRGVLRWGGGVGAWLVFDVLQGRVGYLFPRPRSFLVFPVYLIAQAVRWKPSELCQCLH
jgi:hypothetical protein